MGLLQNGAGHDPSMMPFAHGLGSRLIAIRVFEASG